MADQASHNWTPIEDLPTNWESMRDLGIAALVRVWHEQVGELKDKDIYSGFVARLRREWAIETGVLERLYDLSDSATKTLIEHGLDQSLLASSDTDKPVGEVIALIRDQESAIASMYEYVAKGRSLTKTYMLQLHGVLTAHQATCEARNQKGELVQVALQRAMWKREPNNIEYSDGGRFEFCPPALVESQILNLLDWFSAHELNGVPTEIQAAWLHHRFTLIHPFQDGNGRVARCLASLVMLKADWFPLLVTRSDKPKYIGALRSADRGDLLPLVQLFNELQKRTIRRALGLSHDVLAASQGLKAALSVASDRLTLRAAKVRDDQKKVFVLARTLHLSAHRKLDDVARDTTRMLKGHNKTHKAFAAESGNDPKKRNYYYLQVIEAARKLGYFANLAEYQSWALLAISTGIRVELLFHFHGLGHQSRGVLCCSAIYCQKDSDGKIATVDALADVPFEFTYEDDPTDVAHRFEAWMDTCLGDGIKRWSQTL